jgi:ribokinase
MVVVLGSINLDLVASVTRIPQPGETLTGHAFAMAPGGKGANQALAARSAGAEVALFGATGRDPFAAAALVNLHTAGVDLAGVGTVDAMTGVALIQVADDGENAITVVPGANAHACATQVGDAALGPTTTLLMQLEIPLAEVEALAARAHERGVPVLLNAAPAVPLPVGMLDLLDVLLVNETEACVIADAWGMPRMPERLVERLAERGVAGVVTLGAKGAVAWANGMLLRIPAPAIAVVDTTGAGDSFAGTLAAALDRGAPMRFALEAAVAAGATACMYAGAQRVASVAGEDTAK